MATPDKTPTGFFRLLVYALRLEWEWLTVHRPYLRRLERQLKRAAG